MKPFAIYTLSRIGLFIAAYALVVGVYLLATGSTAVPVFWPFVVAIVVSATASWFLLRGQRNKLAASVQQRAAAASRKFEEARAKEDHPKG